MGEDSREKILCVFLDKAAIAMYHVTLLQILYSSIKTL